MDYGMDYGSMGQIGSSDDFFDTIEDNKAIERITFDANRLNKKFDIVIRDEFYEMNSESLIIINMCAVNMLCSACLLVPEEKRDSYFDETVKSLREIFKRYKKIPPSKH